MFSLGSWSTRVPTGFQVSRGTQERARSHRRFRLREYHPLCSSFPAGFNYRLRSTLLHALQPTWRFLTMNLGYSLFARTTRGISIRFLFLQVLRYFNSLRSLPFRDGHKTEFPHSDIHGSKVVRHLTVAYRSHTTSFIASYCQGIHRIPLAA